MTEQWRTVLNGDYAVSNLGRVRREVAGRGTKPGRLLRPIIAGAGYPMVSLCPVNGPKRREYVHRLVALAFLGPCPTGKEVNHKNGLKADSCLANLEYVTSSENNAHAYRIGLKVPVPVRGEDHHAAKLNDESVRAIRTAVRCGEERRRVASRYGVHRSVIDHIMRGLLWRHVA